MLLAATADFADIDAEWWAWLGLFALIGGLLLVDLLVFHRRAHTVGTKEAAIESSIWIAIGLSFGLVVLGLYGGQAAGEYYAGYLIEKSLSIDNVFVWALIFSYFAVPRQFQHRVLFWGIFGALAMRLVFIFAGVALLDSFDWLLFVFGAFLIFTGARLVRKQDEAVHPENNPVLKLVRKVVPSTAEYDGQKLFTKQNAKHLATPLFAVLVLIETTDVVFAVDSVPAVLAVSREQYIVFASNAFAILGLRALYFLLADWHNRFQYLQQGLAIILVYVGVKMIVSHWYHINTVISLSFIGLVLAASIVLSLRKTKRDEERSGDGPSRPHPAHEQARE
jgi:tellurite resistance protein TerC